MNNAAMDTKTPSGLVQMPAADYHAAPGYSKSHLDRIAVCPMEYWHHYINPDREAETPSRTLVLGQAIHGAVLEPDTFDADFVALPADIDLRTKAGKAERDAVIAAAGAAVIITADERATALACRDAVYRHPVAARLLRGGRAEQSLFTTDAETGAQIKCRPDYFNENAGMIVDLKSTEDASEDGFARSAANYRYWVQAPWYQDVFRQAFGDAPPWWAFLAVEKKPPYKIGIYYPQPDDVEIGLRVARRDLLRILECRRTGLWPDYATEIKPLVLPGWYKNRIKP